MELSEYMTEVLCFLMVRHRHPFPISDSCGIEKSGDEF
jgi:hypothetical protein